MKGKYEKLRGQYPEYISLDQLYKICRIAKRSARYLVQNGIIPATDTGRRTWRYKIAIDDVITYLRRREQWGSEIPRGEVSSKSRTPKNPRTTFSIFIRPEIEVELHQYFEQVYSQDEDVLTAPDIIRMTGLSHKTVLQLLKDGEIKSLTNDPRYIVPKTYLMEFVASPRYVGIQSNSPQFQQILKGFAEWQDALSTQSKKAQNVSAM